ncbi:alcohol dehydrogenase catalytic domain-containing protein [Capillimicrobium parvum]|uniref:Alcohol dehydrogenase n=1 Tax=Capillimicrobium parvum TaxID=2884022 RepID=A0A9E7BZH2_9ACTN|nr:alcohol dehydrogenase catalytic domain-containing protein [Capillimicrobium parvum]UGS35355.1 Alcohol dehydrogenase [Capillimicrobium parvum]
MRAVTYEGPGRVDVVDKPEPEITAPDEAIVRVRATGVCGSDLHIYRGRIPIEPGFTLGHEYVGEVVAVGDEVASLAVGDRVNGGFHSACGTCWLCRRGAMHKCEHGRTFGHGSTLGALQGTQAEYALIPHADRTLRRVPDALPDDVALFAGDVMATGWHAALPVAAGDTVVVLGLGPVGLSAVQAALVRGAGRVIAIDTVGDRLALAERFGAVPVHLTEQSPRDEVRALTDGHGAAVAIDAVGDVRALELAIRLTANTGTVSVIGAYAERAELHLGLAWLKSLTFVTGPANCLGHIDTVLEHLVAGRLDPRALVTHHLALDEAVEAYAIYDRHEALKIVLRPG